jgi:O-antigen/teichoic acid export membrane protein
MIRDTSATIRNAGFLVFQRGFHVLAGLLFAMLIPRAMGPATFGRFALLASISGWLTLFSGLGAVSMMTCFVPQFLFKEDHSGLRKLVSNLFALRLTSGLLEAVLFFLLAAFWLRELDWTAVAFVAGAVVIRNSGNVFFALFLGLNEAARWGMGELVRRWLSVIFVLTGFLAGGLRGACLGLLLTNLGVLALGLWWGHPYLQRTELRVDRKYLLPFLRFGAAFAAGNGILALTQRSGEALVRVASGDYVQVAYFSASYAVYLIAEQGFSQVSVAFAPLLTTLSVQGRRESLKEWIGRLMKWMTIAAIAAVFAVLIIGEDIVPLVLGASYRPVAANMLPLTVALVALVLGSIGRLLTMVFEQPRIAAAAAAVEFAAFWCVGLPLAASWGSYGASIGVAAGSAFYATFLTWRMSRQLQFSLRPWLDAIGLAALFLPLVLLRASAPVNAALYAVFIAGYGALLARLRIVTWDEAHALRESLRRTRAAPPEPAVLD